MQADVQSMCGSACLYSRGTLRATACSAHALGGSPICCIARQRRRGAWKSPMRCQRDSVTIEVFCAFG